MDTRFAGTVVHANDPLASGNRASFTHPYPVRTPHCLHSYVVKGSGQAEYDALVASMFGPTGMATGGASTIGKTVGKKTNWRTIRGG